MNPIAAWHYFQNPKNSWRLCTMMNSGATPPTACQNKSPSSSVSSSPMEGPCRDPLSMDMFTAWRCFPATTTVALASLQLSNAARRSADVTAGTGTHTTHVAGPREPAVPCPGRTSGSRWRRGA